MASYQDIDVRLVGVENALKFMMESMRVRIQTGSPLSPTPVIQEMSMYDFYRLQLAQGLLEPHVEKVNGTDSDTDIIDASSVE